VGTGAHARPVERNSTVMLVRTASSGKNDAMIRVPQGRHLWYNRLKPKA